MCKDKRLLMSLLCISLFLLLSGSAFVQSKETQEEVVTSAEISATIDDFIIPGIQKNWTAIHLTVIDNYGLNWTEIKEMQKDPKHPLYKIIFSDFWTQTWWVYVYRIPKGILGYTSILLKPEYPEGWAVKVIPSAFNTTTAGMRHPVTVYAQVNELASDYNPLIKIRVIRYDTFGAEYGSSYINLPLKAVSLNYAYIDAIEPTKKAPPRSLVNFPIEVTNKGEYRNTFQFNITGESGIYGLVAQQSLTLDSGETRIIQLQVITPEVFYDYGTPRKVDISIYPLGNPSGKISASVIVITEGLYISPLISFTIGIIIVLALLIYFFLFYLRAKRERDVYGKPNKPWTIPEERAHLAELKRTDKTAYEQECAMIEDEYKSALLWYDDYRRTLRKIPEEKKSIKSLLTLFKKAETPLNAAEKPEKKQKKKPVKSLLAIFKKSEKKLKTKQKKKKQSIPADDIAKEKALAKIKSEQEKQLRKMTEK